MATSNKPSVALTASDIQRAIDLMNAQAQANMFIFTPPVVLPPSYEEKPDPHRACPSSGVTLPDGILPGDSKAVGYVYGYRAWEFDFTDAQLKSDSFNDVWAPKVPKKAVDRTSKYQLVGRGAGIYAAKDMRRVQHEYENRLKRQIGLFVDNNQYVIGKVALWGAIKEHQHGYRAEWAYPVSFFKITNVAKEIELALLRVLSEIYLPRRGA